MGQRVQADRHLSLHTLGGFVAYSRFVMLLWVYLKTELHTREGCSQEMDVSGESGIKKGGNV